MSQPDQFFTLVLLGREQELPYEELEAAISPHTGRELRSVEISFNVPEEDSEEISKAVTAAREPTDALAGADGTRWVVTQSSYSYQEGSRVHSHHVELRETEVLKAARLEFLDVAVEPLRYQEDADSDGILLVEAIVEPDAAADERIEQAVRNRPDTGYFDLVRVGVSEQPLRVRFGQCLWQKGERGRLHLLRFVADEGTERDSSAWLRIDQPAKGRVARLAFHADEGVVALLEELGAVGVLGDEAIGRIRARIDAAFEARARELDEAMDLVVHFEK